VRLYNAELPTAVLDQIVIDLDNAGLSDGNLELRGNAGDLSVTSLTSYNNLISKGWTIDVDAPIPESGPQINVVRSDLLVPILNGNTPDIADGTDYGQVGIGSSVTETFEIQNIGDSDLTINFFFTGGTDFSFTPEGGGGIVLGTGESTFIDVTFDPAALVVRTGSITINSNTTEIADQNFVVNLAGEGIVAPTPEVITVLGNGISIPNGSSTPEAANGTDFENVEVGQIDTNTFVIQNDGTADLTVSSIGFTTVGSDPQFSIGTVSETLPFDIAPGGQITFEVVFTPTGFTDYDAVVSINSSDNEENPFEFIVAGVGTEPVVTGDIMISQYYHGFSGVDNWIEVTNISSNLIPANTYFLALFDETLAREGVIEISAPSASTSIPELAAGETVLFRNPSANIPSSGNIGPAPQISSDVCTFTGDDVILISTSSDVTAYNLRVDIMGNISPNLGTSPQPWGTNDAYIKGGCSTEIAHTEFDINDWLFVEIQSVDDADPSTNLALGTQVVGPTVFDGSSWSNLEPDQSRTAIIASSFTGATDTFEACNLTINTGVDVVFDSNGATSNSIVIYGDLIVNGSLTIGDTESLVVYNPTASLGTITKIENSTEHNFVNDLTYWASPVQGSQLSTVFAGSDPNRIFEFRAGQVNPDYAGTAYERWFIASGAMERGRGYVVEGVGTGVQSVSFNGVPFNGPWIENLYFSGSLDATPTANANFNLIGNPYPAAIDMQRILIDNGNVNEIALWTHSTERDPATGEFFDSDYVYYSTTGSTTPGVTENIASGQGFMIRTVSSGAINIIDDYKLIGRNDQFFKGVNQKSQRVNSVVENKLWLRMNLGREKNDILLAFMDEATDGYDVDFDVSGNLYDSQISLIDKKTKFYSKIDNNKFVIQGMGPYDGQRKVSLGFDTKKKGDFRISLTKTLGALDDANIYLIDHVLNVRHDLKRSDYVFYQSETGEFSDRFTLEFEDSNTILDVDELVDSDIFNISNNFDVMNVNSGKVKIYAPEGFLEHALVENVMAGNNMFRRSSYMYGNLLPANEKGEVGAGLGMTTSEGTITIIPPTDVIKKDGETKLIDGLTFVFKLAPNSEAPSEMFFYIPELKALCTAEDAVHTLHNTYTLRGAKIRNPLSWSKYLNWAIEEWGDSCEVFYAPHHWPVWGNEEIIKHLELNRDMYRFINDQTLRLANHGKNMIEIAEELKMPPSIDTVFSNRGYYGTLNHDVKATYVLYLGWFDGNPAELHPLPRVQASMKYVEFMGGADEVIAKAKKSYNEGDYRWVAEVMNHVVFANPSNQDARNLEADALEQLGYQAESGPWRNFYLTGAQELRNGVPDYPAPNMKNPYMLEAMSLDMLFDYLGMTLNAEKAEGKEITLNWTFTDTNEDYVLFLKNSALNHSPNKHHKNADATLILKRSTLNEIMTGQKKMKKAVLTGEVKIKGKDSVAHELFDMMDKFNFWYNIVTPVEDQTTAK